MLEGLERLLELQRLDDELGSCEQEHAVVPERRAQIAAGRAAAEERLSSAKQGVQDAEAGQRRAEGEVREHEALLQKLEGQQFQVRSNDAYTALLHEMEAARQAISDGETRILECMEAIETARSELASAEQEAAAQRSRLDAEEKTLDAREKELGASIERLRGERGELAARVDQELLSRYERVAARRRPALVLVEKEICKGCQVDIPPQTFIEILRAEAVVTCNNCQRILVHQGKLAASAAS